MKRCDEGAGTFKVELMCVHADGSVDPTERRVTIGAHGSVWRCRQGGELHEGIDPPPPAFPGDQREWELHEEVPRAQQSAPFVGELCVHELAWLRTLPGSEFNRHWRFDVKEVRRDA